MRVTNGMITNNFLNNLNNNLLKLEKYQMQLASNKRITKLSDDPVGVLKSMRAKVRLYRTEQYQKNVDEAQSWLKQSETSVLEMNEVLKTAYETAVNMATDYKTADDKKAAGELIGQLRDHLITIGNTRVGDKYIFGGYNNANAPFTFDGAGDILYNGLDLTNENAALTAENNQAMEFEIGFGLKSKVSIPGTELMGMGDDNIYDVVDGLYNLLNTNASADSISQYVSKIQKAQSDVMSLDADLGGRMNRLTLVANRYEDDILNYTEMKSKVEDADQAELIMQYKMAEAVYQSALQIGSSIIQPTLVDFLK